MRMAVLGVLALGLLTAACSGNGDERVATGTPTGGAGALAAADLAPVEGSGPIRRAQSELKREGLYDGGVDGIAGPATTQGIITFQQREGLPQTAHLDRATLDRMTLNALRLEDASGAKAQSNTATEASAGAGPRSTHPSRVTDATRDQADR